MQTRCPYPDCGAEFRFPAFSPDKRGHYNGNCPCCQRPASFRSIDGIAAIDNEYLKRAERGHLSGGPVRDQGFVPQLSVVVEDVRSLWNVGSIFRTADGAAFQHIFLCGITGAPPRREIEKVSLGAEKNISWQYVVNPLTALESLRLGGVQVMGLERTDESITLKEALSSEQVHRPLSLVVGNEVSGLSPQALSLCDLVCHLPMRGMKESLNVAVAYGVAAYMISDHLLPG